MENNTGFCIENCIAVFNYCQSFIVPWLLIVNMYLQILKSEETEHGWEGEGYYL